MRYRFSLFFCCLLAPAAHAFDTTTAFTAKSLYVTSKLTSTPFENAVMDSPHTTLLYQASWWLKLGE
ncbi:hypothetical protein FA146_30430, partial [Pseudomonas aeruginosa]|nr:hypothetical protein [Pseudomonas aeruginosa]